MFPNSFPVYAKELMPLRTSFVFRRQHIGIAFLLYSGSLPGGLPGTLVSGTFLSFDGFIIQQDCCGKREELLWNCKLWHSYCSSANLVEIYGFSIRNSDFPSHARVAHAACSAQWSRFSAILRQHLWCCPPFLKGLWGSCNKKAPFERICRRRRLRIVLPIPQNGRAPRLREALCRQRRYQKSTLVS